MDYKYIEQLLERYWNDATTLEEEAILRSFFSQEDIPASLVQYKPLFTLAQAEREECVLGADFDAAILELVDDSQPVKAKTVSLRERFMPLFRAVAVVAVFLSLGQAAQVAFQSGTDNAAPEVAFSVKDSVSTGMSIAKGDSVKVDTLKKVILTPDILK